MVRRNKVKKNTVATLAKKVNKLTKENKPEVKFYDVKADITPGTTASVVSLVAIAQGVTQKQRVGNQITGKRIDLTFTLSKNSSSSGDFVRVILFADRQQVEDTAPTAANILETYNDALSPYNLVTLGKYKIFHDRLYNLDAGNPTRCFRIHKRFNHRITYNGVNDSDVQKNGIYVLVIGDDNTNKTTIAYSDRFSYTDL